MEKYSRPIIAALLVAFVFLMIYNNQIFILFILFNLATTYDVFYLWLYTSVKRSSILLLYIIMIIFNSYWLNTYYETPYNVIKIATITQLSDIFQYYTGQKLGLNKIGWISKNKTYEGYILGLLLTLLSLSYVYSFYDIIIIFTLGIIGGLISSLFKRIHHIKDYSNLLGSHGGWIDRIDSIIIPQIIYHLF